MAIPVPPQTRDTQAALEAHREAIRRVVGAPHLDGVLVEAVTVDTTDTNIAHGLGRVPKGWQIVDLQGDARVWRTARDKRHLTLRASASVVCDLWVW